ncbi:hypothetical protein DB347_19355 [Opitutaceae bacterium EW11]|nr:hypothetical protein DB347_19355 [Opitutaceae bacterium EW11]
MSLVRSVSCLVSVLTLGVAVAMAAPSLETQPVDAPLITIDELHPGQTGIVWTVFQGSKAEPFKVEVTGVIRNALGPGKSLILCQLTDPRVQNMGAVAGMSGSPLYIDGKLAGALSYQIQKFETVRYAGFTPIADLLEVSKLDKGPHVPTAPAGFIPLDREASRNKPGMGDASPASARSDNDVTGFSPLTPMFALGGVAPSVASLFGDEFHALGLNVTAVGGSTQSAAPVSKDDALKQLQAGAAVAVALATGDITLAGTGTVSHVDGDRVLAFGHPLMGLGNVDLPMALAEIVAILPSSLNSFKISNTGAVIGTISQDRLSAIYGEVGRIPQMLPIEVKTPHRTLHFSAVRHPRLTPTIAAMGLSQAVLGSNDNGLAEGFRVSSTVSYPDGQTLSTDAVYAGPQGFSAGLDGFIRRLSAGLTNPIADVFPTSIAFSVEPLPKNPVASLDYVQLSRSRISPGETLTATLSVRDFQGAPEQQTVQVQVPAEWTGKKLELLVANGDELDKLSGRPDIVSVSQIRSFSAYLDLMRQERSADGLYVAVVERASAFLDQTQATLDYPGSVERIARSSDESRFQKREVLVPLWETHVLAGKVVDAKVRRGFQVMN